jgi:hypothetical protein
MKKDLSEDITLVYKSTAPKPNMHEGVSEEGVEYTALCGTHVTDMGTMKGKLADVKCPRCMRKRKAAKPTTTKKRKRRVIKKKG